jgi:ParB-like chromosome segregation protein Spo0J
MKSTTVTQMVEIYRIKPYEKNAKKHPESQIKKLAEIIQEFGFRQSILVDQDMVIVSGHGRLLAAKLLGMKEVPVNIADDLTPQQIRAYRIADNKIAETDWDLELLETEIREIDNDLLDYLGFEDAEIERLLSEEEKKQVSFDAKEYGEGDFSEFDHKCPKCGFEYDDK